jgi:5-methylthioadenosine/S-adenosylhomocysteine deaminase
MIGRRMVVENRKLLTVDLAEVATKVERARARLEAVNRPARALYDKLEKIVGTFCPGLAKEPLHIDRFAGGHHHHDHERHARH